MVVISWTRSMGSLAQQENVLTPFLMKITMLIVVSWTRKICVIPSLMRKITMVVVVSWTRKICFDLYI